MDHEFDDGNQKYFQVNQHESFGHILCSMIANTSLLTRNTGHRNDTKPLLENKMHSRLVIKLYLRSVLRKHFIKIYKDHENINLR